MICPYEGSRKVVTGFGDRVSHLYCEGHAEDFRRRVRDQSAFIVKPRNILGVFTPCEADWTMASEVPT